MTYRKPIDTHTLHTFVTQKYHWRSLNHEQQMSMAVELMKLRVIVERQLQLISQQLDDGSAARLYRDLLVKVHDDVCHEHYYVNAGGSNICMYCGEPDPHG